MSNKKYSSQKINYYANELLSRGAYNLAFSGYSEEKIRKHIGKNSKVLNELFSSDKKNPGKYGRGLIYDKVAQRIKEIRALNTGEKMPIYKKKEAFNRVNRYANKNKTVKKKDQYPNIGKRFKGGQLGDDYTEIAAGYSTREVLDFSNLVKDGGVYEQVDFVFPGGEVISFREETKQNIRSWLNGAYTRLKDTGLLQPYDDFGDDDDDESSDAYSIFFSVNLPIGGGTIIVNMTL